MTSNPLTLLLSLALATAPVLSTHAELRTMHSPDNQLLGISHKGPPTVPLALPLQYTYDALGNRLTMKDPAGAHAYTYDPRSQLTAVAPPAGFPFAPTTYTYDAVGNRTQVITGGVPLAYSPNLLNQYSTVGPTTLTYDPNGNLTSDGTRTYTYDAENRLLTATGSGLSASYTYDAFGRRIIKTVNGVVTGYLYDGDQLLAETDATGTLTAKYLYGPGIDEPLRMDRAGTTSYYHADGLGSIVALTNATGTLVEQARYDAYGTPQILSAAGAVLPQSTVGNRFLFTGREYDQETGLYFYRARSYSPTLGRFLQRDPLGYFDGPNPYTYARNNPVNRVDPKGTFSIAATDFTLLLILAVVITALVSQGQQVNFPAVIRQATILFEEACKGTEPKATDHGAKRLKERDISGEDYTNTKTGEVKTQTDGAKVYIKEIAPGKYNVIIEGKDGEVVTGFKNLDQKALENLAQNYGWH